MEVYPSTRMSRPLLAARICWSAGTIQQAVNEAGTLTRQLLAFSREQLLKPWLLDLIVNGSQRPMTPRAAAR